MPETRRVREGDRKTSSTAPAITVAERDCLNVSQEITGERIIDASM